MVRESSPPSIDHWSDVVEESEKGCKHHFKAVGPHELLREYAESLEDRLQIYVDIAVERWLVKLEDEQDEMYRKIQHKFIQLGKNITELQQAIIQMRRSANSSGSTSSWNKTARDSGDRLTSSPSTLSRQVLQSMRTSVVDPYIKLGSALSNSTALDSSRALTTVGATDNIDVQKIIDNSLDTPVVKLRLSPSARLRRGCTNPQRRRDAMMGCHNSLSKLEKTKHLPSENTTPNKIFVDVGVPKTYVSVGVQAYNVHCL